MKTKTEVNYRLAVFTAHRCGACAMFRPDTNRCTLVKGIIFSDFTCKRWVAK